MKVNVVKLGDTGNTARIIHVPVDLSNMLRIEIEVDGYTYHVQCGEAQAWPDQGTGLRIVCVNGMVIKPIASNAIEISGG